MKIMLSLEEDGTIKINIFCVLINFQMITKAKILQIILEKLLLLIVIM